ncbi:MAG: DeoR/GlpR transcriptional regulator [Spirochaetales bacterium]|nr:DeoR/GlpR transcriptional regulator [Spirochaetales bacterium]
MNSSAQDGRLPAERQQKIISMLKEEGAVRVTELSELLDVSVLTIRRDLDLLEKKGVLERSHGGAILRQTMMVESHYIQREKENISEKQALAAAAVELIEDGDTVFVNSGSTNRQVLLYLAQKKVRIVTNHAAGLEIMDGNNPDLKVILTGGSYRHQSRSMAGSFAVDTIRRIFANKAIIGGDGVSMSKGITTPIQQEADVARQMIEQTTGDVIVLVDHTKIGVVSNFSTAPMGRVDFLISDLKAGGMLDGERLKEEGVELILIDTEKH